MEDDSSDVSSITALSMMDDNSYDHDGSIEQNTFDANPSEVLQEAMENSEETTFPEKPTLLARRCKAPLHIKIHESMPALSERRDNKRSAEEDLRERISSLKLFANVQIDNPTERDVSYLELKNRIEQCILRMHPTQNHDLRTQDDMKSEEDENPQSFDEFETDPYLEGLASDFCSSESETTFNNHGTSDLVEIDLERGITKTKSDYVWEENEELQTALVCLDYSGLFACIGVAALFICLLIIGYDVYTES
jgi:hypothetical protein